MLERSSERGQVLPFVAICLAALMGFAGFAVDLGYIQYQQRQQQSATDAAAIAGAQALISNNACPDQTAAQTAAANDSASNGFTTGAGNVTVLAVNPPASGPFSADNCAVQVNVTSPHATWFSKVFGFSGKMTTTATAVIESKTSDVGCIYVLEPTGTVTGVGNSIDATNCGVVDNGSVNTVGGSVTTGYFGYAGTYSNTGTTFSPAATTMLPVTDPCPDITGCHQLAAASPSPSPAPPSTSGCSSLNLVSKTSYAIPAGCYSSITMVSSTATMSGTTSVGSLSLTGGSITMAAGGSYNVGSVSTDGAALTEDSGSTYVLGNISNVGSNTITLQPGDYGGISGTGANVTLDPGLYVFFGSVTDAGGSMSGTGVTIYQESGGFDSVGASDSLSACSTSCTNGAVDGVLYYQPPNNNSASEFVGTSDNYSGLIYAPTSDVSMVGAGTHYVIYVVGSVTLVGGTLTDTAPTPAPGAGPTPAGLFIKTSVLAL